MKNSLIIAIATVFAFTGAVNAQTTSNSNATANAHVITPITMTNGGVQGTDNLEFGTIINSANGGSVVVSPTSVGFSTTTYNGVSPYTGTGSIAPHRATFVIGGQAGYTYSTVLTINGAGFNDPNAVLSDLTSNVNQSSQTLGSAGETGYVTDEIYVGGTVTLTSSAAGTYAGSINCAVTYN